MNVQHKSLADGRWATFSFNEQMGHIGSEVERALNWKAKGVIDFSERAFKRSIELIDLSLKFTKDSAQLKEFARLREILVDLFVQGNKFNSDEAALKEYLFTFAYEARKNY